MSALLLAVDRIIGSIEIDDDARWRPVVGVEEEIDNQPLDCLRVMVELVVPVTADLARMLEPIERRLAGEPVTGLVEHGGKRRIIAQRIVVDQVLVPERDAENALAQQIGNRVADGVGNAQIGEASREAATEPGDPIGRSEQNDATVGRDGAAVESAHKFAAARPSQIKLALATLCRHRG